MASFSTGQYTQAQQVNIDATYRFANATFSSFEKLA
jgi:hypothetical protein